MCNSNLFLLNCVCHLHQRGPQVQQHTDIPSLPDSSLQYYSRCIFCELACYQDKSAYCIKNSDRYIHRTEFCCVYHPLGPQQGDCSILFWRPLGILDWLVLPIGTVDLFSHCPQGPGKRICRLLFVLYPDSLISTTTCVYYHERRRRKFEMGWDTSQYLHFCGTVFLPFYASVGGVSRGSKSKYNERNLHGRSEEGRIF